MCSALIKSSNGHVMIAADNMNCFHGRCAHSPKKTHASWFSIAIIGKSKSLMDVVEELSQSRSFLLTNWFAAKKPSFEEIQRCPPDAILMDFNSSQWATEDYAIALTAGIPETEVILVSLKHGDILLNSMSRGLCASLKTPIVRYHLETNLVDLLAKQKKVGTSFDSKAEQVVK